MTKDETKMSETLMKYSFDFWQELFAPLNKQIQWVAFIYFFSSLTIHSKHFFNTGHSPIHTHPHTMVAEAYM